MKTFHHQSIQTITTLFKNYHSIRFLHRNLSHSTTQLELKTSTVKTLSFNTNPPRLKPIRDDRLLLGTHRKKLDPHLEALLKALHHPLTSVESPSILNGNDFDTIRTSNPKLFSKLSLQALETFLRYLLASRFDSFTLRFIEELSEETSVFSIHQRTNIFRILIRLSRTKRQWLSPQDKELIFVSDGAVTNYFTSLLKLVNSNELHGLGPEDLRSVMRALRRSSHPLFWDANLVRHIWQVLIKTESNDNRRSTNARLGIRSILHWLSNPGPTHQLPIISQPSPAIWSLCLQIWSQLIDWGEIIPDDLLPSSDDQPNLLSPVDLAILTMLAPIIRSASRRYSNQPLNRDNAKLFKNACEALEFLLTRSSSAKVSSVVEDLVPRLLDAFLHAVDTDHRAPAPEIIKILIRYPSLPTVSERWTERGISDQDYRLYERTLDTLHSLGRASLLVDFWLGLLPLINVARAGWPLSRILTGLEELSNPLVRAVSGKPLNGFKFCRLVLKVVKALSLEKDSRLVPSRRQAFRLLVERQDLHTFDWLSRVERQFDRDGIELKVDSSNSSALMVENIQALFQLWQSSWGLSKRSTTEADGDLIPLPTLIGVTKLVQNIRNETTELLLKMVISRFIADRTPALTEEQVKSKYLINPRVKLTDIERSKLIESHLTIGGELSQKFLIESFEGFLIEKIIPSVEDLKFLYSFLLKLNQKNAIKFWKDQALNVNGLPWDIYDHSKVYPTGWDQNKIEIAKEIFIEQYQPKQINSNVPKSTDSIDFKSSII